MMVDPRTHLQAARYLVVAFRQVLQRMPVVAVTRLIAQTTAGMAVQAGLKPDDEEDFIATFGDWMREAFDHRQELEMQSEQHQSETRH